MVKIREGQEGDSEGVSKAHVASVQGVDGTAYSEEELTGWKVGAAAVSYTFDDPETVVLIAETDGEIAGFAEATFEDRELNKLYVDPAYQNQGIATLLSDEIDMRLGSHGIDSLYVEASVNAVPFYEQVGYERIGTHQKPIPVDGNSVKMEMVDMEKELRYLRSAKLTVLSARRTRNEEGPRRHLQTRYSPSGADVIGRATSRSRRAGTRMGRPLPAPSDPHRGAFRWMA